MRVSCVQRYVSRGCPYIPAVVYRILHAYSMCWNYFTIWNQQKERFLKMYNQNHLLNDFYFANFYRVLLVLWSWQVFGSLVKSYDVIGYEWQSGWKLKKPSNGLGCYRLGCYNFTTFIAIALKINGLRAFKLYTDNPWQCLITF